MALASILSHQVIHVRFRPLPPIPSLLSSLSHVLTLTNLADHSKPLYIPTVATAAAPIRGETFHERSKGKDIRMSNIVAAKAVATAIRTSLGPRGMDKMIQKGDGEVLISNDGATILSQMQVMHPTAKMLVELSKSQDIEAGDGTTSVCVIAGALLDACGNLLNKGIHPTQIASSFMKACNAAEKILER